MQDVLQRDYENYTDKDFNDWVSIFMDARPDIYAFDRTSTEDWRGIEGLAKVGFRYLIHRLYKECTVSLRSDAIAERLARNIMEKYRESTLEEQNEAIKDIMLVHPGIFTQENNKSYFDGLSGLEGIAKCLTALFPYIGDEQDFKDVLEYYVSE